MRKCLKVNVFVMGNDCVTKSREIERRKEKNGGTEGKRVRSESKNRRKHDCGKCGGGCVGGGSR